MTSPPSVVARAEGVHVSFGGQDAVCHVDLAVPAGRLIALAGANGAGKSTLLEVLAGVRRPSIGRVALGTRAVAFVPQRAAVPDALPVTVRDVVRIGAWGRLGAWRPLDRQARTAVAEAMERMDVAELARRPFGELSGGQRQRALLAQGLARRADLLLLDEPTTGLDTESADRIRDAAVAEAARGAAVVCVSHDERMLAAAARVIRLESGRIVADSSR